MLCTAHAFIVDHYLWLIWASAALQIAGTAILGLFSFYGIKIKQNETWTIDGNPISNVTINGKWMNWARGALIALLAGIALASLLSMASTKSDQSCAPDYTQQASSNN